MPDEFVFEPLVLDTKDENLTIKILQRTMERPDFIAFPGTPEAYEFMKAQLASDTNKVMILKEKTIAKKVFYALT